jgi:UDP-N-acetylglucosamine 2-epimerase (non-hydrolysing)
LKQKPNNMKIILVCGARPNFMKIAPLWRAMLAFNEGQGEFFTPTLVHTGQHYDYEMSRVFFEDLGLPEPDIYLNVGSGTHAEQTGRVMIGFEKVLLEDRPDLVVTVGDVNSTLAASLVAVKLHVPAARIEAGTRMFDLSIPEEANRICSDLASDYLFTPCREASDNLRKEGIPEERIFFVGNIMADSLLFSKEKASQRQVLSQLGLKKGGYALLTLHRPDNVDDKASLARLLEVADEISRRITVVFPAHPRTQKSLREFGFDRDKQGEKGRLRIISPLGYLDFLNLEMNAKFVMTDSGGVQTETTVLDVPCLTLYDTIAWRVTVEEGTNTMVGTQPARIVAEAAKVLDGGGKKGKRPELWDGKTAERIIETLRKL